MEMMNVLTPLPLRPGGGVFQNYPLFFERFPQTVGFSEVAAKAGLAARFDDLFDLRKRHWRFGVFAAPQGHDAQYLVELLEQPANRAGIVGRYETGIDAGVQRAHQVE